MNTEKILRRTIDVISNLDFERALTLMDSIEREVSKSGVNAEHIKEHERLIEIILQLCDSSSSGILAAIEKLKTLTAPQDGFDVYSRSGQLSAASQKSTLSKMY